MSNPLKRMMIVTATGLTLLTLTGCYGTQGVNNSSEVNQQVEPCAAIRTLTDSYEQQFRDIRKAQRSLDRITIWSTDYQIVGSSCEIWGWQGGNYNYVCHYVAPDQSSAEEIYQRAKSTIRRCLPAQWTMQENALAQSPGSKAVFSLPEFGGVIDLRMLQTRGITTSRWAVYLMIGDYNSQL